MGWEVRYTYVAVKPITAEHPIGSGTVITYQPGEEVPAGEWGRAADNLVEVGKVFRTAINVWVDEPTAEDGGEQGADVASEGALSEAGVVTGTDGNPDETSSISVNYPEKLGGGYWLLSDGTKLRGKAAALAAQAELDAAAEA